MALLIGAGRIHVEVNADDLIRLQIEQALDVLHLKHLDSLLFGPTGVWPGPALKS
jgi:hypothetical protein